ncbi:MAG: hypothetical protein OXH99_20570 [Bryobacterales bacterium]|nr:hypothetical protein [Bryobacterales bacterium]
MSDAQADKLIGVLERQDKQLRLMLEVLGGFSTEVREMRLEIQEVRNEVNWDRPRAVVG